jgi:hypothetical protein
MTKICDCALVSALSYIHQQDIHKIIDFSVQITKQEAIKENAEMI